MAATKTKKKGKKKGPKKAPKKTGKTTTSSLKINKDGTVNLNGVVGVASSALGKKKADSVSATLKRSTIHIVKDFNPRAKLGDVEGLASNIKRDGLIHDIVVRPQKGKAGHYIVVAGERRLRAVDLIGWKSVPCKIRLDLAGLDDRARAVAIAENSEDGRTNLNAIEIGRVVRQLQKKGWAVGRIAQECLLHPQKVRRCLSLITAPQDVQMKVEAGELSMIAGLEMSKLDDKTRASIKDALTENPSAAEVKRAAKKAAKDSGASATPGKAANKQTGAARDAALAAWRGSRDKQKMIMYLADLLNACEKDDVGSVDYHETRGALAALLWDRGDIDGIHLPPVAEKECENSSEKKFLKKLNGIIAAEAKNHVPEDDDEE